MWRLIFNWLILYECCSNIDSHLWTEGPVWKIQRFGSIWFQPSLFSLSLVSICQRLWTPTSYRRCLLTSCDDLGVISSVVIFLLLFYSLGFSRGENFLQQNQTQAQEPVTKTTTYDVGCHISLKLVDFHLRKLEARCTFYLLITNRITMISDLFIKGHISMILCGENHHSRFNDKMMKFCTTAKRISCIWIKVWTVALKKIIHRQL